MYLDGVAIWISGNWNLTYVWNPLTQQINIYWTNKQIVIYTLTLTSDTNMIHPIFLVNSVSNIQNYCLIFIECKNMTKINCDWVSGILCLRLGSRGAPEEAHCDDYQQHGSQNNHTRIHGWVGHVGSGVTHIGWKTSSSTYICKSPQYVASIHTVIVTHQELLKLLIIESYIVNGLIYTPKSILLCPYFCQH